MPTQVSLQRCGDYSSENVMQAVRAALEPFGGMGAIVKPGETVLLKPNMLAPAAPEKAVTTHPAVVKAVAQLVMESGGKPFIGDSPAVPGFKMTAKKTGLAAVAEELGIPLAELKNSAEYKQGENKLFRILEISKTALEADRIINLPKLKTHSQMYMTLGVKNIFGCVVGSRKSQWHFKAGIDRVFFARMLVELYDAVSPDITIMDGIVGMEGDGPGPGGTPRQCGIISAATDAVAMDRVLLDMAGGDTENLFTIAAAREMGIGETDLARIRVMGVPLEELKMERFVFPQVVGVLMGPKFLQKLFIDNLTPKPKELRKTCTLCEQCINICPTDVISARNDRLHFDYDRCIRCFCCVEVCPEGSMKPSSPLLLKLVAGK
ncbi:MAG: DUF362 domain-containing protein [Nitrospinae bacterium]|nr:DUF362 domain-containing protein [Nitrospinota bacterium]